MIEQEVRYGTQDFHGRLFIPAGASPCPGVIVFHEGTGISKHSYAAARRLAEAGYVALAADYYGGGYFSPDLADPDTMGRYARLVGDSAEMRARGQAALDLLAARPEVDAARIAAIGYCFGGTMALELALSGASLVAMAGFHMNFMGATLGDAGQCRARLLICNGADDPFAPVEQRAAFETAMRGSGVRWQMNVYGGVRHSFTNPDAQGDPAMVAYDACADRESWNAALFLLRDSFAA